jgi:TonB family protein
MKYFVLFFLFFSFNHAFSQEEIIFDNPQEDAEFPGGPAAMHQWIAANIRYPEGIDSIIDLRKVYISFVVQEDGSLVEVQIERGSNCAACDAEAIRLVKSMPKWKPGRWNGEIIGMRCRLPIKFDFAE